MSWNRRIPCSHKAAIGCVLTTTAACCSCSDNRPIAPTYNVYVDGEGMLACGSRWQSYCWKCRDYWSASSIHSNLPQFGHHSHYSFDTGGNSLPPSGPEGSTGETMPYTQSHPNGLGASWWAHDRTSTSSTNPYGQSSGLLDTTNRPQQQYDNDTRRDRERPRMRQRPMAPLGTREDVESEDYVSPLSMMFHRAHDRYRVAEETRRQAYQADQFMNVGDENTMPNPLRSRRGNSTDNFISQQEFPEQFNYTMIPHQSMAYPQWIQNAHAELDRRRLGLVSPEAHMAEDIQMFESLRTAELRQREQAVQLSVNAVNSVQPTMPPRVQQPALPPQTTAITFDNQPRPPPRSSEDMIVNIACTICSEHPINVVLLPCWHACMCNWCADLCVPTRRNTPFARPPTGFTGKCPKCRAVVKERRELFLG